MYKILATLLLIISIPAFAAGGYNPPGPNAQASGGGSGISNQYTVSSGSSYTATQTSLIVMFNSSATSSKTLTIPTSTGSYGQIVVMDIYGNAATYNITVSPVIGSIKGPSVLNANYQSITLIDTPNGWLSI